MYPLGLVATVFKLGVVFPRRYHISPIERRLHIFATRIQPEASA